MIINEIPEDAISKVARKVFGDHARVASVAEIRPLSEHGLWKISGCNKNLSFVVALEDVSQKFLFRFTRGFRVDRFDVEIENYRMIADGTDIPTPTVYCVDRSRDIVPTSYMVMDYMTGDEGGFLSHPDNPSTDEREKAEIEGKMGYCYAQIHGIERKAPDPHVAIELLLYRLTQLEHVVQDGQFDIDLERIDLCRRAVERDRHLLLETESLCVADAELHFVKANGGWEVSFICDMEWVGFGDPYSDLPRFLCDRPLWDLDSPLLVDDPGRALKSPFFRGYEELRQIDYERLLCVAVYYHLGVLCSITDQVYRPEKRDFMRSKEPIIVELVEAIAKRAPI